MTLVNSFGIFKFEKLSKVFKNLKILSYQYFLHHFDSKYGLWPQKNRNRKTKIGNPKSEIWKQNLENQFQKTQIRKPKLENWNQKTEIGKQKSENKNQKTEIGKP